MARVRRRGGRIMLVTRAPATPAEKRGPSAIFFHAPRTGAGAVERESVRGRATVRWGSLGGLNQWRRGSGMPTMAPKGTTCEYGGTGPQKRPGCKLPQKKAAKAAGVDRLLEPYPVWPGATLSPPPTAVLAVG
eukprot:COSAG02_NODE_161_length_32629_cov_10.363142_8_plen_133_part_00